MSAPPPRKPRRLLTRVLWTCVALALALGLVRAFVLGVYHVDSASMEPFLHGDPADGEWVLVRYTRRPELERLDPVVLQIPGERDPIVKRVVAFGGETVQVVGGDVLIDGKRLGALGDSLAPVPVYDERFEPLDKAFQLTGAWERVGDAWRMDPAPEEPAIDATASFRRKLLDQRLDLEGALHGGRVEVGDAILELDLDVERGGGRVGLRLSEDADTFELLLEPGEDGLTGATLLRRGGSAAPRPLEHIELALAPGEWHRVRFSNVDNRLELRLDGQPTGLRYDYEANTPQGGAPDPDYRHQMPRVVLWAAGRPALVKGVRILRDVDYTQSGTYAVRQPLTLGPDELFVLGDNSAESVDSRELGPVPRSDVLGVPIAVVWPPSAWRRLSRSGGAR